MADDVLKANPPRYEDSQLSEVHETHRRVYKNRLQAWVDCLMLDYRSAIRSILGNDADTTYFYDLISRSADTATSCLMEEYLITQNGLLPSTQRYEHITDTRRRIGDQLIAMVDSFDCKEKVSLSNASSFKRQMLKMSIVNQAIDMIQKAALGAAKEFYIELFPIMALAHSLIASANQAGEYICRCLAHDKKPTAQELRFLLSSPPHGMNVATSGV